MTLPKQIIIQQPNLIKPERVTQYCDFIWCHNLITVFKWPNRKRKKLYCCSQSCLGKQRTLDRKYEKSLLKIEEIRPFCVYVWCSEKIPHNRRKYCSDFCSTRQRWMEYLKQNPLECPTELYPRQRPQNYEEKSRKVKRWHYNKLKTRACELVAKGNVECVGCGELDEVLLDIHHKNKDGYKERRYYRTQDFLSSIVNRIRKVKDLELVCIRCHRKLHRGRTMYDIFTENKDEWLAALIEAQLSFYSSDYI